MNSLADQNYLSGEKQIARCTHKRFQQEEKLPGKKGEDGDEIFANCDEAYVEYGLTHVQILKCFTIF